MADNSTTTVSATFQARQAADLAVEHLVQEHGISRPAVFAQSADDRNTAGSAPLGGDTRYGEGVRGDAPLAGGIEISADIVSNQAYLRRETLKHHG
ncbi:MULTISPECIES: hypothetical protein [unclassified Rhizobium]|uniref:hypothetical protein n=1 Tax=unclassified Rhizobium TaxID=2613769 RepID=UPI00084CB4AF|nr:MULTISPECIES: hypothetical protein [unclassified Rhizobium]OEC95953.1 hypothetical protein A9Z06_00305 [Rhizobium sp. YK2]QYA16158.1 hypothetical protein J5284_29740 [Rhizobium sp. AB2/73]UEQ84701.1 hypothetical protein I8E17_26040 [Rhizobium sp. AB2/73]